LRRPKLSNRKFSAWKKKKKKKSVICVSGWCVFFGVWFFNVISLEVIIKFETHIVFTDKFMIVMSAVVTVAVRICRVQW